MEVVELVGLTGLLAIELIAHLLLNFNVSALQSLYHFRDVSSFQSLFLNASLARPFPAAGRFLH